MRLRSMKPQRSAFMTMDVSSGQRQDGKREGSNTKRESFWYFGVFAAAFGGTVYYRSRNNPVQAATYSKGIPGKRVFGYKEYSAETISKHITKKDRIWVSWREGVYDITDFIEQHPGGKTILMAAGGPLDPFWDVFAQHHTPEIMDVLEEYRIGNLMEEEGPPKKQKEYVFDPMKYPLLIAAALGPYLAKQRLNLLKDYQRSENTE
ncbi:probable sulfite oxidase, mitochondrial [Galendromus occidentalis]|uniref:Probable sulfite oxidase, mitochondrial n=1 Tax=Galendromus occidentalis TaxID=34638 RepID=A0AAJ6QRQ4_9ACAR|nr:probable sulfite oxidase, mitochondrial [Galendromus occidentalis]